MKDKILSLLKRYRAFIVVAAGPLWRISRCCGFYEKGRQIQQHHDFYRCMVYNKDPYASV